MGAKTVHRSGSGIGGYQPELAKGVAELSTLWRRKSHAGTGLEKYPHILSPPGRPRSFSGSGRQ
jgi:hypothetical protein